MRDYNEMTLALLDFEIDKLVFEKEALDNRIARLYELREDMVTKMNEETKKVCCNKMEMFFDD